MKNTRNEKLRSDKPSGRQAAELPEHSEKAPDSSSLHQGQGPDFPTQDSNIKPENPGIGSMGRQPVARKDWGARPQNSPETIEKARERDEE